MKSPQEHRSLQLYLEVGRKTERTYMILGGDFSRSTLKMLPFFLLKKKELIHIFLSLKKMWK
jgi:hypothetical protein